MAGRSGEGANDARVLIHTRHVTRHDDDLVRRETMGEVYSTVYVSCLLCGMWLDLALTLGVRSVRGRARV